MTAADPLDEAEGRAADPPVVGVQGQDMGTGGSPSARWRYVLSEIHSGIDHIPLIDRQAQLAQPRRTSFPPHETPRKPA